jgi:hypothetical protein
VCKAVSHKAVTYKLLSVIRRFSCLSDSVIPTEQLIRHYTLRRKKSIVPPSTPRLPLLSQSFSNRCVTCRRLNPPASVRRSPLNTCRWNESIRYDIYRLQQATCIYFPFDLYLLLCALPIEENKTGHICAETLKFVKIFVDFL